MKANIVKDEKFMFPLAARKLVLPLQHKQFKRNVIVFMALNCEGQNRMIFSVAFLGVSGHSDYSNLSGGK